MTYNTPELLLVGAAQNLVLLTSVQIDKVQDVTCSPIEEPFGVEYNEASSW